MDQLIRIAWRAFWVGLGASVVLITQSLVASPTAASATPSATQAPPYELPWGTPVVTDKAPNADRLVPRDPFDAMSGRVMARVRDES